MNNTERLFWLSGVIFLAFFCMNKINHIDNFEFLDQKHSLAYQLQADQINELTNNLHDREKLGYDRGFKAGEHRALIATINGEALYDYQDGYHAAIDQFVSDNKTNIEDDAYSIFLSLLDIFEKSEDSYQELLELHSQAE